MRRRLIPLVAVMVFIPAGQARVGAQQMPYVVQRFQGEIIFDGFSDEPGWEAIVPLPVLTQQPTVGNPPSEPTEIRVAYDDVYFYLSGRLYQDPATIQGPSLKRDDLNNFNDYFGIILDTFNDNENAVAFFTTPAGIRLDFTVFNDAQPATPESIPLNLSWDTFWDVEVVTTNEGWFVEMRIPVSSLRFTDIDGRVEMGMIVWRWTARSQETSIFPVFEPIWGVWSPFKPSMAQQIVFEEMFSRKPLYLTPFILGGKGFTNELNDDETAYLYTADNPREFGLDLKYGLTSNLTLDFTLNTDFAQVEADDQQVNLSRFSLFFPEKRRFFQERASIFNVSLGGPQSIFYSRRIGLYEGEQVPILGGVRLVGRMGKWDLGLIDMQTEESTKLPGENFGVLRVRRQVFNPYSKAGAIVTSRIGKDGSYNLTYALDSIIRVFGDDYVDLNWAQSFDDAGPGRFTNLDIARFHILWDRRKQDGFFYSGGIARSGSVFDPAMGFMLLEDYRVMRGAIGYGWVPQDPSAALYRHNLSFSNMAIQENSDGTLRTGEIAATWNATTRRFAMIGISLKTYKENLLEPYKLSDKVEIPIGNYTFYGLEAYHVTPAGRLFFLNTFLQAGRYYDGTRISLSLLPSWSLSPQVNLQAFYQLNRIVFNKRDDEFTAHIGRLKLQLTLSTRYSAMAFVQYNSAADIVFGNIRMRYNPREGNDLYIVYNQGINTDRGSYDPLPPVTSDRTLMVKYAYTFIF